MENPFIQLHREFRAAGAKTLISSGQACVLYGISAFSKDGDWIVETIREYSADLQKRFVELKNDWSDHKTPLRDQHQQVLNAAYPLLQKVIPNGCP